MDECEFNELWRRMIEGLIRLGPDHRIDVDLRPRRYGFRAALLAESRDPVLFN